jgi:chloramphenicol-sensitive protein RarD
MNKGILAGAAAYAIWGFFPIYFHALKDVSPVQVTAHRIVWSFLFLILLVALRRELRPLKAALTRRVLLAYLVAGVLLTVNWLAFVWGVGSGYVVEASLGYFINPLVNVVLGVVFLRERLRPAQWAPVILAAAGVVYLTVSLGSPPRLALLLAFTFGFYGLTKKLAPLGSLPGLTLETGTIFVPALAFLLLEQSTGSGAFIQAGLLPTILLALIGLVTAVPLLLFATAAKTIPLSTMGLLQFISPTLQFLIGVFLYGEPFTSSQVVGFAIIWAALILFSAESYLARRGTAIAPAI